MASLAPALPTENARSRESVPFAAFTPHAPLFFGLAMLALAAFAPQTLNDGDTFWHIEAGRWTLAHGAAPHGDPFSAGFQGTPWTAHEWLSEVFMALAYGAFGLKGVTAMTGAAIGLSFYALAREVRGSLRSPAIFAVLGLALLIASPSVLARPHILALPAMTLWCLALFRARRTGLPPPLPTLAWIALWANMHGGFVFGLALIAPFGFDALIGASPDQRFPRALRWASFALLSVCAATLTPYGVEGLLFPLQLAGNPNMAVVNEWQPEKLTAFDPFAWALLAILVTGFTRGLKLRAAPAALLLLMIAMTLQHTRHALLFAFVAPLLLARPLGAAFGEPEPKEEPASARVGDRHFAIGALLMIALRLIVPQPLHDTKVTPVSALDAVPANIRSQPVFNNLADGGYLILQGVRPFIDGRFDMYPKTHVDDYGMAGAGDAQAAERVLDDNHIAWTFLPPNQKLVGWLDRQPGWKRLYADAYAVVHVRDALSLRGTQ
jgi:hypothetical protein